MGRNVLLAAGCALTLALPACGGGAGGSTEPSPKGSGLCSPSGTELSITVMNTSFDKACLAAPAGSAFTIRFDNEDSNTHNLDVRDGPRSLFAGQIVIGPKVATYDVPALPPGVYMFRCDVHPTQMHGTFVVRGLAAGIRPSLREAASRLHWASWTGESSGWRTNTA